MYSYKPITNHYLKEHVKLILGHDHPESVTGVHDKDNSLAVPVVMLPEVPVSSLTRHIERREANIAIWNLDLGKICILHLIQGFYNESF